MAEVNENIIETVSEDGTKVKFEVFDVIEFEEKEYALLTPINEDGEEDEEELVLMRLIEEGDDYVFETIDDDDEFERLTAYIETFADEEDEDEDEE